MGDTMELGVRPAEVTLPNSTGYAALVRVTLQPEDQPAFVRLSQTMASIFARQPGFRRLTLLKSLDGTTVLSCLEWDAKADSEACQSSPEVAEAGAEWMGFIYSGRAQFAMEEYELVSIQSRD
jgi:heme-degrading monooxygenase HmoA